MQRITPAGQPHPTTTVEDRRPSDIWSGSDFPYVCLKDRGRTDALIACMARIVEPGDVVVDIGSGSGILALAAARAGAQRVMAVEIDALMAGALRRTIAANGLENRIEVIQGDARELSGVRADVVAAEIIDTGLLDEPFVPVLNQLAISGVIDDTTRLLFAGYTTTVQLVRADQEYYGFTILAPKHEWPYYEDTAAGSGWWPTEWTPVADAVTAGSWTFGTRSVDTRVEVVLPVPAGSRPNAVTIEGTMHMGDGSHLGAFNSLNGAKLIPLELGATGDPGHLMDASAIRVEFEMGGGLQSVRLSDAEVIDLTDRGPAGSRLPGADDAEPAEHR